MKLLFDQNLSPKLAARLADLFPDSAHVQSLGLDSAQDEVVWDYCAHHDFVVVTKDEDFNTLSVLRGSPPKVIWVGIGNCKTADVEALFRGRIADIAAFEQDPSVATLLLG